MAVPTTITDLSATIASNVPAGTDQAFPYLDDYLRAAYGFIRQGDTKAADVASAATVDLGAVVGRFVDVTGTTTITSFGTVAAGIWRIVTFTGALTLTHNATSLILPGGLNITTAAGDSILAESLGSGNWRVVFYMPASPATLSQNGSMKFPGGLILNWGLTNTITASGGTQAITFATPFTASCYNVQMTPSFETSSQSNPKADSLTTSGFTARNLGGSNDKFYWMAIGK